MKVFCGVKKEGVFVLSKDDWKRWVDHSESESEVGDELVTLVLVVGVVGVRLVGLVMWVEFGDGSVFELIFAVGSVRIIEIGFELVLVNVFGGLYSNQKKCLCLFLCLCFHFLL